MLFHSIKMNVDKNFDNSEIRTHALSDQILILAP